MLSMFNIQQKKGHIIFNPFCETPILRTMIQVVAHLHSSGMALSLVAVEISTGRRHQIRAHTSHAGHVTVRDGSLTLGSVLMGEELSLFPPGKTDREIKIYMAQLWQVLATYPILKKSHICSMFQAILCLGGVCWTFEHETPGP